MRQQRQKRDLSLLDYVSSLAMPDLCRAVNFARFYIVRDWSGTYANYGSKQARDVGSV